MAEARTEEEEENMRGESREQVVRRPPNGSGGRPDRRKPDHRQSQGPLSSIRAAIKRTSARSTSVSETPRDRDRRRPEITILSAEPLTSTSWFPGAAGGFPPPPPPAAQVWGATIPPSIQPPPSYEEVIREKTHEQVLFPSSSSASSSSSHPVYRTTIATQTDPGSDPDPQDLPIKKPVRPPRPPVPSLPKPSNVDDITNTASQSTLAVTDNVEGNTPTPVQCCDPLSDLCSPLTSTSGAQTDQWDRASPGVEVVTPPSPSPQVQLAHPRPRPRSKLSLQPVGSEVKVQTLVKLRDDGVATLAARGRSDAANQEVSPGKYLQELLEAFSSDDWGFPDHRGDGSGSSQSESEDGGEGEELNVEDMAALKARIQAFEQQQVADGSSGDGNDGDGNTVTKKPEPRPRPRLQGQPGKAAPPAVAPKPKILASSTKPSSKSFWEDCESSGADLGRSKPPTAESNSKSQTAAGPSDPSPALQPSKNGEKPAVTAPKPQSPTENLPSTASVPIPAPRPPPPKLTPPVSESAPAVNPKPPPRPPVAPRSSVGLHPHDKKTTTGPANPDLPTGPPAELGGGTELQGQTGRDGTVDSASHAVTVGSVRPDVPSKPAALTSPRRASAPTLAPKPTAASPAPSDPNPAPVKPVGPAPKPSCQAHGLKAPAPALRRSPVIQTKAEPSSSVNPNSSDPPLPSRPSAVKPLPVRPPPIKSIPGRPPPPASKTSPASSTSPPNQPPPSQVPPSVPANQTASQRASKRGPPLPPRPKPGHPLYNSYMKQEVLIVLDDPSPAPSDQPLGEGRDQTNVTSIIKLSECLLDLDTQPDPVPDQDSQSKQVFDLSESKSILPVQQTSQKEHFDLPPVSGPQCIALFDYEGEEEDELTFCQGDVIALLELIGQEWGRGQIHGRVGIFPLSFAKVMEPLPQPASSPAETVKKTTVDGAATESPAPKTSQDPESGAEEWAVALFDFPGQTAEDLSFHKGALIEVIEHVDAEWRKGRLEGREGLYPAAFTQTCHTQPITGQPCAEEGVAKALFDFAAESEDELTLKAGDIITQVELVDEQWILGVVGGKRGMVPKNYISLL